MLRTEDELRDTHAWMKQLKDLLKQACGPYTALPKSSKDEALLQLGALETWLKNGAPDRPKERVEEPTDETPAEPTEDDVAQEEAPTEVINGVEMGVWIVQLRRLEFWVAVELAKALLAGLLQKLTKWKLENGEGIELPCEIGDGETEQIVLRILKHALALLSQAADWDACWTSAVETVVSDLGVVVLKGKAASETMLREWLSTLEMLTSAPSAEEEAAAEEDVDAEEEAAAEEDAAPEEEKEAEPELSQEELAQQEALRRQQEAEAQLLAAQQVLE